MARAVTEMEQSVRQEVGEIDKLSSMHFGLSTILSCRKQSQWMRTWLTSRRRIWLESRQIQSQHQVECSENLHLYPLHGHRKKQTAASAQQHGN